MKAVIMAGGYGTRLGRLGEKLPKPFLPLNSKITVLDYIFSHLKKFLNEKDIIIVTNEKFKNFFYEWAEKKNFKGKIIVEPHRKDEEKFGTIKGLRWAIENAGIKEDFLVIASDNVIHPFSEFLERMMKRFNGKSVVVGAFEAGVEKIAGRFGNLKIEDGGKVVAFVEKPQNPISPYAAMAIYLFPYMINGKSIAEVLDEYLEKGNPDAPGNFIAFLVERGFPLYGNVFAGKWWDVGKVEDWHDAMKYFEKMEKIIEKTL